MIEYRDTPVTRDAPTRSVWRDFSASTLVTGLVAVLVGYGSSAVIIFQAAEAAGASDAQIGSWLWALGIGMGLTSLGLSLRYRMPILTAWSTPGAALLATSLPGVPMEQAIGAFLFSAALITLCGVTGLFGALVKRIPPALAAALLAGVLLRFGIELFATLANAWLLPLAMLASYVLGRRFAPRYAIVLVLLVGVSLTAMQGELSLAGVSLAPTLPVFTAPAFSLATLVGVGIPLFVVTMATQNLPGITVLRAAGYRPPTSPLIGWTGAATLGLAPFGGFALNLAAISAAVCMGREAHEDPSRRYTAGVAAGVGYLVLGVFGATVTALFAALPGALIAALAGLALLGTIGNGLAAAMADERQRDAALVTFLFTASGVTLLGIGAAFWGLVAGMAVLWLGAGRRPAERPLTQERATQEKVTQDKQATIG
ncbi:benzoate/H(+) symporter BenE family transporter [Halomonas alkalicola]|uniref:Benzoate/H(+) symporter BenE family transporter n=1 Tax=Halomonas alkalicola TaxID=1930622 RepID=A0ABY9H668_9GAMM|nr:benzoate/H(+) symporter BenE family transporter [Halomonas alkalicola]WLI73985.1 benzoate/H(+) symporter BenE family transporter [Halomonas alkalicola]